MENHCFFPEKFSDFPHTLSCKKTHAAGSVRWSVEKLPERKGNFSKRQKQEGWFVGAWKNCPKVRITFVCFFIIFSAGKGWLVGTSKNCPKLRVILGSDRYK